MKKSQWKGNLLLLLTAFIWGSAFVAQSAGMDYVQPFTFNMARSVLGGIILIPIIMFFDKRREKSTGKSLDAETKRRSMIGGVFCGVILAIASNLQQVGISMTTAGKAGFITALYIILVPLIGMILGKKVPKIIWLCVVLAIIGFYLLCVKEGFSVSAGDLIVLACAVFFSFHILVIDHFVEKGVDGVRMSCVQFWVAAAISLVLCLIFEKPSLSAIWQARITVAYAGFLSSGVAYTLQIIGQEYTEPTTATLLMSLESVFAALSGWLILHESMSAKELFGCIIVFVAVILAQIPLPVKSTDRS